VDIPSKDTVIFKRYPKSGTSFSEPGEMSTEYFRSSIVSLSHNLCYLVVAHDALCMSHCISVQKQRETFIWEYFVLILQNIAMRQFYDSAQSRLDLVLLPSYYPTHLIPASLHGQVSLLDNIRDPAPVQLRRWLGGLPAQVIDFRIVLLLLNSRVFRSATSTSS
jgi:hypothetical protein